MFPRRHGFGASAPVNRSYVRLPIMIGLMVILGVIVFRGRQTAARRVAEEEKHAVVAAVSTHQLEPTPKLRSPDARSTDDGRSVVGPSTRPIDAEEQARARNEFEAVTDRAPLTALEMASYWRLMNWSSGRTLDELEAQGRRDVLYTQLWEQPEKFRGEVLRLRLHVVRVLIHDAPANNVGLEQVYEVWGWTDDSKSFPYVVVCSELPAGMKVGAGVHEEAVFSGYFFKLLSYESFDKARAAPLLIGRLKLLPGSAELIAAKKEELNLTWGLMAGGAALLLVVVVRWMLPKKAPQRRSTDNFQPFTLDRDDISPHFDDATEHTNNA